MLGLGWPQWITIIALVAGLVLTFRVMARASVAYERARRRREAQESRTPTVGQGGAEGGDAGASKTRGEER